MRKTRITIEGLDAVLVGAIGVVAGIVALSGGLHPTNSAPIDAIVVIIGATAAVWAMAAMPWWVGLTAATVVTASATTWWVILLGVAAALGSAVLGTVRQPLPVARAGIAALVIQVAARLDGIGPLHQFSLTAALGVGTVLVAAGFGFRRHTHHQRVIMWWVLGGVGMYFVLSLVGLVVGSVIAEDSLREGNRQARAGLEQFKDGNLLDAAESFANAARNFADANADLTRPWTQPARLIPIVAQHHNAAASLTGDGAIACARIADVLRVVDYSALSPTDGRIDIDAVTALETPLREMANAIGSLDTTLDGADSEWLLPVLSTRIDTMRDEVAQQRRGADNAVAAVEQAPAMLGADGVRTYFVAFTTPVEARASGGFMGNWAELTIDDGQITMTGFGRTLELNDVPGERTLPNVTDEYVANYGTFIFSNREQRIVGPEAWSNITTSPHFPTVAATIADLYPQSGGTEVDGVFMLDVYAIARLMAISGPVNVELADGQNLELTTDNAAQYLLTDQYATTDEEGRRDALETVARTTLDQLLNTTFPSPPQVADLMSPMAREGRLTAWATREAEHDVFQRLRIAGELPEVVTPLTPDGTPQLSSFGDTAFGDGFTFAFTNATGNKIDNYLDGTAEYDVVVDRERGIVDGTLTLTIRNSSPTSGWPEGIIGNELGLPVGTNRTWLSVYTALPITRYSVDGREQGVRPTTERGWWVASNVFDIEADDAITVVIGVRGYIDDDHEYRLAVRNPPLVRPFTVEVTLDGDLLYVPFNTAGITELRRD